MAHLDLVHNVNLSRHVARLAWVRRMDFALIFYALNLITAMCADVVMSFGRKGGIEIFGLLSFSALAGYFLFVGARNVGSISSAIWGSYVRTLWILIGVAFFGALVLLVVNIMQLEHAKNPSAAPLAWRPINDETLLTCMQLAGMAIFGGLVTLLALLGLKSMKIIGMDSNLQELVNSMTEYRRTVSGGLVFSRLKTGNLLKGIGFGVLGVGTMILAPLMLRLFWPEAPHAMDLVGSTTSLYGGFATIVQTAGFALLIRMRRYFQVDADTLRGLDSRPPIIFLRSFEDEEKLSFRESGRAIFDYSLETRLSKHFMHFGPFVAVGSPKDDLPVLGAARVHLSEADWQEQVRRWMKSSQAVVIYPGRTYWVNWELAMLVKRDYLHKVIVLFPPQRGLIARLLRPRDDMMVRLSSVKSALQGTRWSKAMDIVEPDCNLRALIFREDATVTAVRSKGESRDAYHLATLVAHQLLMKEAPPAVLCRKARTGAYEQWPIYVGLTRIGAGPRNDILLTTDGYVSSNHAQIERIGNDYAIVDLSSSNGTFVNGSLLRGSHRMLKTGDEIKIGETVFELRAG